MNIIVTVVLVVVQVKGAERCQVVLDPNGCQLSACRKQCLQTHNGNGVCVDKSGSGSYLCVCFFNCPLNKP